MTPELIKRRELSEKVEEKEESKVLEIKERELKRLFEGKATVVFSDMYLWLPESERKKIKERIKASDKLPDEKKSKLLSELEAYDPKAIEGNENIKKSFRELTPEEWKEWENKIFPFRKKEVEARKTAADELTKKELKMKELLEKIRKEERKKQGDLINLERLILERFKLWFEEMDWRERARWGERIGRLEEIGETERLEKKILEAAEKEQRRFIPLERESIEDFKRSFIKDSLGRERREELVDYHTLKYIIEKKLFEEVERERR